MFLLLLSFIAGVLTVLAPCTLPLLPVIVGGSMTGGTNFRKALTISISLGASVILFTFLLKVSSIFINIPPQVWSIVSGGIILFLGLVTLFPALWDKFSFVNALNRESNKIIGVGYQKKSLLGDIIIGAALGPVFSSCSPTYFLILATVLPRSLLAGFFYLLAYAIGLSLMLLFVSFAGQKIIGKLDVASDSRGIFKKVLGVIFILMGIGIMFGYDRKAEVAIQGSLFDITKIEQMLLQRSDMPQISQAPIAENSSASSTKESSVKAIESAAQRFARKSRDHLRAPEITNPSGFVNTDGKPVTLAQYKGKKVVLVDIWTYSCINCQRTLPYVKAWYEKYKDQGFEVIGIHTPEFSFEKLQKNVEEAVKEEGIKYPVVLDNDFGTWNAFGNSYWPRKYLIDTDGFIVYDHIGEGDYDGAERAIQKALAEQKEIQGKDMLISGSIVNPTGVINFEGNKIKSPETYFGSARNEYLANGTQERAGSQTLTLPSDFDPNSLYLSGTWNFTPEYAENTTEAKIVYKYNSKNVYMVMSAPVDTVMEVWQDGKLLKTITVKEEKLYTLVENADYGIHTLELRIPKSGLKAFTFTFG